MDLHAALMGVLHPLSRFMRLLIKIQDTESGQFDALYTCCVVLCFFSRVYIFMIRISHSGLQVFIGFVALRNLSF